MTDSEIDMNELNSRSTSPDSVPHSPLKNGHSSLILSVDFVEFWVGNAKITSKFYCNTFQFHPLTFKVSNEGEKKRNSYVIYQKETIFMFTSTTSRDDEEFNNFLKLHGDAVRDVALRVSNVEDAFHKAIANGARIIEEPHELIDSTDGVVVIARIAAPFGDVIHTLIDRSRYTGSTFMPHYYKNTLSSASTPTRHFCTSLGSELSHIDHVTLAYEQGDLWTAMDWYIKCFGFYRFVCNEEDGQDGLEVVGQESGLKTIVMSASSEKYSFKFVLVEALLRDDGKIKNQIQEFIEFNGGSGIQHIALHTKDMITTVDTLRSKGVEFIEVPGSYYDALFENEASFMKDSYNTLKDLGILLDISFKAQTNKQPTFLMQTFTLPLQDRPTFFLEIISRRGSTGFGKRTIKALFEAIEQLQERRKLYTLQK